MSLCQDPRTASDSTRRGYLRWKVYRSEHTLTTEPVATAWPISMVTQPAGMLVLLQVVVMGVVVKVVVVASLWYSSSGSMVVDIQPKAGRVKLGHSE